ncbi:MAG: lytic murein transglycosylase [Thermoleophilaceae bacterium]
MTRKLLYTLLATALVAATALAAFTLPASAEKRTITVRLANGQLIQVTVDVPPGIPLGEIDIPGVGGISGPPEPTPPASPAAPGPSQTSGATTPDAGPTRRGGSQQKPSSERRRGGRRGGRGNSGGTPGPGAEGRRGGSGSPIRNRDGSPTPANPGYTDSGLPGPSTSTSVPNFVIRKFRVPIFLLPIYQAAGIQYGIRWEILAAINEIETDYGRNLNVSSAGAMGWMQFIPSSWRAYGVDANKDGKKDPYNPVDAIFAAARYLKAADYEKSVRRSIFAYNHADWYVDSVMMRARLIAGVPGGVIGGLTGLTEGRFPVYARARYADDLQEKDTAKRVARGQNAAQVIESSANRRSIDIFAKQGSPVVATNDGVIRKIGQSEKLGKYIVLQDVYGNSYRYSQLGSVAPVYPVPKDEAGDSKRDAKALSANDPKPGTAASAGRQLDDSDTRGSGGKARLRANPTDSASAPRASVPVKERLFARPDRPNAKSNGGLEQMLDAKTRKGNFTTFQNYFSRPFGLKAKDVRLKPLKKDSRVIGGTILGRIGKTPGKASHLEFAIRPAGKGAPRIDPKPILDGWKLLEATAIYRASGRNVLYGDDKGAFSIGQILLLPKPLLERRVLSDNRVDLYPCGRSDVKSGQIDRRVLATLEYLAESGMRPTVTSLKCGHSVYTSAGGVSHHSSGNAVDIAQINGISILGHQDRGGITEQAVRRLMRLQGTLQPDQVISLLDLGGPTFAMGDHADHIHVGFRPLFGDNKGRKGSLAVLKPNQWGNLLERLRQIDNPVVPIKPSKSAIPVERKKRASDSHRGE